MKYHEMDIKNAEKLLNKFKPLFGAYNDSELFTLPLERSAMAAIIALQNTIDYLPQESGNRLSMENQIGYLQETYKA